MVCHWKFFDGTYSVYGSFGFKNGNMKPGSGRKLKFPDKKIKNKELGAFAFFVAALTFRESEPMVRFVRNIRTADPRQVFLTVSYFQKTVHDFHTLCIISLCNFVKRNRRMLKWIVKTNGFYGFDSKLLLNKLHMTSRVFWKQFCIKIATSWQGCLCLLARLH